VGDLGGKQTIVINKSGGQTIRYLVPRILPYVEAAPGNASVANSLQKISGQYTINSIFILFHQTMTKLLKPYQYQNL
jgi:hypothetical protein